MRIALAQITSTKDPAENLRTVREEAARARDAGAELIVFPEATMATFATRSADVAEPLEGPWVAGVRNTAGDLGIAVIVGMFTPGTEVVAGKERRVRNTLVAVGADGAILAHYDKIHLFDAWGFVESRHVEPGRTPCLVTIGGVRMGLATCYDVRFGELFKHLARAGADVVVVPASWANGRDKVEQWRALCVARAMDSTCFVVGVGQADPAASGVQTRPGAPTGVGHSVVVDPFGGIVVEADAAPELVVVDIDVATVPDARAQVPVLANTRFVIAPPPWRDFLHGAGPMS